MLQSIAIENNLSETAFLVPDETGEADFELRWFTPAVEVALCGHATLASGHFVLASDPALDRVNRSARASPACSRWPAPATAMQMALPAWTSEPRPLPKIVAALGIDTPVETLWQDRRYALIVLETEAQVRALTPDFRALAAEGDVLAIATAPGTDTDIVSRVFVPGVGVDEDPVTGSAHAVSVPYWAKRLGRDSFTAFQASQRGGRLCSAGSTATG